MSKSVKVEIVRDCDGPGDGFKVGQLVTLSESDAELMRRRGFGKIVTEETEAEKK
jgi:hypothetical protein